MDSRTILFTAAALGLISLPVLAQKSAAPAVSPPQQHELGIISSIFSKEVKVQWSDVPVAVQKTITANAHGGKADEVEKEIKGGKAVYEVKVKTSDNQKIKMKVGEDGALTEFRYGHKEGTDVSLSDVPKAVQKTITDNAHGGKIDKVEKETKNGETVYEAKVKTSDDNVMEIKANENGDLRELKTERDFF